jgi:protein-S-isoprenylcysteine O-methyltransferase Ste14
MQTVGWIVTLGGLLLAGRSALLLAGRGRPKRGPTPTFVIAGPYCRVRNPLLAGLVLGLAGLALATQQPGLGMLTVGAAVVAHVWVVRREEPRLRARFGEAYEAYLANVPRWFPRAKAPAESPGST